VSTLVYVVGARPNFVKMAPVVAALRARLPASRHFVVHTGQHYDPELSDIFFDELGLPPPDYALGIGSGDHGAQITRAWEAIEGVLKQNTVDAVVVAGDVNSTLAGALAGIKCDVPVAHVESGLRSFDRSMPEEINRLLVDQISRWCFIHSPEAVTNLVREGVRRDRIHDVGNTMIDTLVRMRGRIAESRVHYRLAIERGGYVLVTLHRPSLVDGPLLPRTLASLGRLARTMPVVFPVHPRTRSKMPSGFEAPGLLLIDPIGYVDFLALETDAAAVITDSGGVQEESTFLRVPCFTLRANTERPVTLLEGTNTLLGLDPEAVEHVLEQLPAAPVPRKPLAGWDGNAAGRLADVLAADLLQMTDRIGRL
jgi:UDP-N-acetylglucosamine 2-epimerase (non-hydrolysing)